MTPKKAIAQLAKMVGHNLSRGKLSDNVMETGPMLAGAGATADVVDCLFAEARRKRPSEQLISGYAFILQSALDSLRLNMNGGAPQAREEIEEVRQEVAKGLSRGGLPPAVLMLVAKAFVEAQLDPGRALQEAMMDAMETEGNVDGSAMDPQAMSDELAKVAKALDDDPFAIHAEIASSGAAFPAEHRGSMAAAFAASDIPAIREAALGYALDPDADVCATVLSVLSGARGGQPVSSTSVDRLVRIRPWLPEARRPGLDAAIRALRPKATPPLPATRPEIRTVLASMCDGSGAQSLFSIVKRGRRLALASVLVKAGVGVADAWVRDGMTKSEAEDIVKQIVASASAVDVSIGLLERRVADALVANLDRGVPPPFGLLQVTEILGLGSLRPEAVSATTLVDELLADVPTALTDAKAALASHRASARWIDEIETVSSWFEAGDAVDALLRPLKTRLQRIDAMLTMYLPARRMFWAERCAWMAAMFKEATDHGTQNWIDFALVARDFAGDQPLSMFPITKLIAEASADVFASHSARR